MARPARMQRQIDKVVVAQLLEAVKEVLDHLSRWKIELNEQGQDSPDGLGQTYGRVRRLRDYLQRCVSAYPSPVMLDLGEEDENLLVSCAVFAVGMIDLDLQAPGRPAGRDRSWLEEKRRNLSGSAVKLASRPVERIPSRDPVSLNTPGVRGIIAAVLRNVSSADAARTGAAAAGSRPGASGRRPTQPSSAAPKSYFGHARPAASAPPHPTPSRPAGEAPRAPRYEAAQTPAPKFEPPQPSQQVRPALPAAHHAATTGQPPAHDARPFAASPFDATGVDAGGGAAGASPQAQGTSGAFPLIDPRRIRDPRLRAMLAMDVSAYERSYAAHDYRLAMVHLASVFEGAVLDYVIPRYKQLGIKGPPETWKVEDILVRIVGDSLSSMDRAYLLHVIAARNLIRPSIQLHAPMVVTVSSLEQAAGFVRRTLVELGYTGTAGQPAVSAGQASFPVPPGASGHFRDLADGAESGAAGSFSSGPPLGTASAAGEGWPSIAPTASDEASWSAELYGAPRPAEPHSR